MKKLNRLLYSNKFFAMIMLMIQIGVFVGTYIWLSDYSKVLWGFSTILSAVLIIYEINREDEPTFKVTWITLISIVPVFGALFYLYTRTRGVTNNIRDDYERVRKENEK